MIFHKSTTLVIVLCVVVSAQVKREADRRDYDSSESRENHHRFRGRNPQVHNGPTGFAHFSPPRPSSSPFNIAPPLSPASKFSIFAAAPVQNPNQFFQTQGLGHQQIVPATLTHFTQTQSIKPHSPSQPPRPVQNTPPRIHQSHRFGHSDPFRPSPQLHPFTPKEAPGCPGYLECQPAVFCAPFHDFLLRQPQSKCGLAGGHAGLCCPPVKRPSVRPRLFERRPTRVPIRRFSIDEINDAAKEGLYELQRLDKFDLVLQQNGVVVTDSSRPEYGHLQFFRTSPAAREIGRGALKIVLTSGALSKRFNLNPKEAAFGLDEFNTRNTIIEDTCPAPVRCTRKDDFYRTADGSCNNMYNPELGRARTGFNRIVAPHYENGIESPRSRSQVGVNLPSARVVSISNIVDADRPSPKFSLFVMLWGQFIDHDLAHAPIRRFNSESGIECCDRQGQFVPNSFTHSSCFPIELPADDPFFRPFGRRCMNFVRSQIAPKPNCTFGFEEQMNQLTHFLDGSNVYGSSEDEERALRSFQGGLLKTQNDKLLPPDLSLATDDCALEGTGRHCFLAGDNRVNEQPDLTVIHTVWVRQHNRIARKLAQINPHWNDETLYQETRRIIVAQMQHIIYNEWLPLILGPDYALNNGLLPLEDGFSTQYDPSVDARILNEFTTVAFRFGHTLVEGMRDLFDKNHRKTETIKLHDNFNNPRLIYTPGKLEEFLRGLAKQPMQSFDNFVSESLTNRLFQTKEMPFGMDLIALNIQRARDHAIAPYNTLREACGLGRARDFNDLRDTFSEKEIERFRLLYPTVDDIDPFIGGISEEPVPGGIVGPLFRCIIADQFQRLRRGDRFFYDNGGMRSSFTEAQLHEIRKTSWARIVCDNGMNIQAIQPLAFLLPGSLNEKTSCDSPSIPMVDCYAWTAERNSKRT